jgi:molybdate-binding protein
MTELEKVGRRYARQRAAVELTHRELVEQILAARAAGVTLRDVAAKSGLSFARIHQIEKESRNG